MIAVPCWSFQPLLDVEALRRLDVFQVDATEGRLQRLDDAHNLVGIGGVDLDVEDVYVGEALKKQTLALHHRLAGQGADVAQAQHRRAVGDHGDQVAASRVLERLQRVLVDLPHRLGHPRRVGQGEVALGGAGLGQGNGDLAGATPAVVLERVLAQHRHRTPS